MQNCAGRKANAVARDKLRRYSPRSRRHRSSRVTAAPSKDKHIPTRSLKWYQFDADKAFWLFAVFATLVFLMGGGSRYDISSIAPLRAITALLLALAIWLQTRESVQLAKWPVLILALLAAWMTIQLIPLPFDMWTSLSDRQTIADIEAAIGLSGTARPLTLSPLRTANSLASLVVPVTAFLLIALLDDKGMKRACTLVIAAGVISALLGIAQVGVRGADQLYFYAITNPDSAVGLFSNRNHNALFMNIALAFGFFRVVDLFHKGEKAPMAIYATIQFVLVTGILVNGSRFGFFLLLANLLGFGLFMMWRFRKRQSGKSQAVILVSAVALFAGLLSVFANAERLPALDRYFANEVAQDQRVEALPTVIEMASDHFPYGLGFGAFEQGFRINEPTEILSSRYFNHAHNDWLQLVVEGGLPAVLIVGFAFIMLAKKAVPQLLHSDGSRADGSSVWLGVITIGMIAAHSIVDYPLRTPSIMLVGALAVCLVIRTAAQSKG